MTTTVALQKCSEYDFDKVYQSIKKMMELVPPPDVKGKTVLLKPNILYPKAPELAVCTHPVVVGAAVKAFVELGAKRVIAGESPAIANSTNAAKATGMYDQVVKNGGEWADFKDSVIVQCPQGKIVKSLNFAKQFLDADIVVSLSKLKSHQLMSYTGAMKNLFGFVIGLEKAESHYRFSKKSDFGAFLTDLNIAANPQYAIMDAIVGMEGPGGPGSGDPINLGFLAASDNILALDWKCSSLVGYNPHNIVNLEDSLKRGIWLNDESEVKTVGESEEECRCTTFKIVKEPSETLQKMMPAWLNFLATGVFTKTPHFNANKCKKCRRCEQICPAHIITMTGKNETAQLTEKKKCLHCFCCHEICPADAIKLRRF
ncbi:DUF362 domain-containing protein [Treponema sp.]|uniref:DUF362 domain-containing protein n=1 Tax=Treponema sp. TaxID=166 RepID=UPI00298DDBCD|nr:DUF362 domain-containing protein [Treponema sp.]MCR5613366.1 DUF362 domain-containing protein [Treponema sp.]